MRALGLLRFPRPADDHEAWFADRYAQLLTWATRLTGGDRGQAEDLVHDVFVQFMTRRPDLTAIENPDGYLYTSLRHHQLANARRTARQRETVASDTFDLLAHDSLPSSVRAWRAQHFDAEPFAQQLRDVWRYAQHRKGTAKTASVLLLRYFHGYYPGEIAEVLRLSRATVGQLLHLARKEARLFMADPDATAPSAPDPGLFDPPDLILALRDAALRSDPHGVCLADEEVASMYRAPGNASVPTATAAHLVSCARCLDRANRVLGLPPLADRHPLDRVGPDRDEPPPRSGSGSGSVSRRGNRPGLDEGRQRLADLLTHRPQTLRIAVNGIVLGSQAITSSVSRQTFRLTQPAFDFLEVLSETETRLLLVSVDAPPRGPVQVRETVALSDGRRLDVQVDFSADTPEIEVSYLDHSLADCPLRAAGPPLHRTEAVRRPSIGARVRAWVDRWVPSADTVPPRRWRVTRSRVFAVLLTATALGGFLWHQSGHSVLSAAELLERSRVAEALWRSGQTEIVHRTLDVDVRSAGSGQTIRRRVEVWHGGPRGVTVRRAYDENDRLLAGEWIDGNGTRTVRRARSASGAEPTLRGLDAWRLEPSADDFTRIVGMVERAAVREETDRFVIAFTGDPGANAGLASASLTLRDDWRAVQQQAVVRAGADTLTFSWTERAHTVMPPDRAPEHAFDVDEAFAPAAPAPPAAETRAVAPATADLEIAALAALRRIDADLGEEVRVRRANGRLSVTGIVSSTQRRTQILSALDTVRRDPAAQVRIDTLDEWYARPRRRTTAASPAAVEPETVGPPSFGLARIPLHDEVRAALVASGIAATAADDEVARVADRIIRRAQAMRIHAWALRRVLDAVPAGEAAGTSPAVRAQQQALVAEHARTFLDELAALTALVRPVLPDPSPAPSAGADAVVTDDRALDRRAREFVAAADRLDTAVQAGFMLPESSGVTAPATAHAFWQVVHQAALAAEWLARRAPTRQP